MIHPATATPESKGGWALVTEHFCVNDADAMAHCTELNRFTPTRHKTGIDRAMNS